MKFVSAIATSGFNFTLTVTGNGTSQPRGRTWVTLLLTGAVLQPTVNVTRAAPAIAPNRRKNIINICYRHIRSALSLQGAGNIRVEPAHQVMV
jgi:hypothetical protein